MSSDDISKIDALVKEGIYEEYVMHNGNCQFRPKDQYSNILEKAFYEYLEWGSDHSAQEWINDLIAKQEIAPHPNFYLNELKSLMDENWHSDLFNDVAGVKSYLEELSDPNLVGLFNDHHDLFYDYFIDKKTVGKIVCTKDQNGFMYAQFYQIPSEYLTRKIVANYLDEQIQKATNEDIAYNTMSVESLSHKYNLLKEFGLIDTIAQDYIKGHDPKKLTEIIGSIFNWSRKEMRTFQKYHEQFGSYGSNDPIKSEQAKKEFKSFMGKYELTIKNLKDYLS